MRHHASSPVLVAPPPTVTDDDLAVTAPSTLSTSSTPQGSSAMDASRSRGPRLRARRTNVKDVDNDRIVAELYREYHRPLLAFVMKLVGNDRQWAEDVVQETMIRAWRSADQLDADSSSL